MYNIDVKSSKRENLLDFFYAILINNHPLIISYDYLLSKIHFSFSFHYLSYSLIYFSYFSMRFSLDYCNKCIMHNTDAPLKY